jgi:8-amino-7-oxononanoate synthase
MRDVLPFEDFLATTLEEIDRSNLRRRLRTSACATGPSVLVGDRRLHNFASNDYLGLAARAEVIEAAVRAARDFGAGTGASRLVTGTQTPHRKLEEKLAECKGTEGALLFATGYAASTGALSALATKEDTVFLDRLSHACLIDGVRLSGAKLRTFAHNDPEDLDRHLRHVRSRQADVRIFVVTESVFSMDGDCAPLPEIVECKDRHGAVLVLDEAHAVGVIGRGGRGLAEACGMAGRIEVQMGTLGKALGSAGGYVSGSRRLIDFLVNRARSFLFSTAPPAAAAAAAATALDLCLGPEGDRLRTKLAALRRILDPAMSAAILPVVLGSEEAALQTAAKLEQLGFLVPAIRPPTVPRGTSRLRISLSAAHDNETVIQLRAILQALSSGAPPDPNPDDVCPVCGAQLTQEKCKVVCRSAACGYRIVFNCSEF